MFASSTDGRLLGWRVDGDDGLCNLTRPHAFTTFSSNCLKHIQYVQHVLICLPNGVINHRQICNFVRCDFFPRECFCKHIRVIQRARSSQKNTCWTWRIDCCCQGWIRQCTFIAIVYSTFTEFPVKVLYTSDNNGVIAMLTTKLTKDDAVIDPIIDWESYSDDSDVEFPLQPDNNINTSLP